MTVVPLHQISPAWNDVLKPFRERDYKRALELAQNFLRTVQGEPSLGAQLERNHFANINYTIAESAYGALEDHNGGEDLDEHGRRAVFFEALGQYLRIAELGKNEAPQEGWWQMESFPSTLLDHALRLLLDEAGAETEDQVEIWIRDFLAIWPELALNVLLEALHRERANVQHPRHFVHARVLAQIYLRLTEDLPNERVGRARSVVMDMLSDLAYFAGTEGAEDEALAWAERAIEVNPSDQFARQRIQDIHGRRVVVEQIRRYQHDANTAIAGLVGNLSALERLELPDPAPMLVERMRRGLDRIKGVHRFVQGQQAEFRVISLREEVERFARAYPGVRFRIVGVDDQAAFETDPEYLQIVLEALIQNAMDAFERRHIPAPERLLTIHFDPGRRQITVRDNAGGIDPRIRDRIFEPYVSTKAVKQTTGLGLSNARAIMALLDGRLDLAAVQPADGSEFTLQF